MFAAPVRNPSYRCHKATGQAVVTLNGRDFYLGKYGSHPSKIEYDRVIAKWLVNGRRLPAGNETTIGHVIALFWPWVEQHYRRHDGTATSEVREFKYSLRTLNYLFGNTPVAEFGPLAFKSVRQLMVTSYDHPKYGHQGSVSRGVVNQRMGRVKRFFKWAVENELAPPSVFHGLLAVRGLERGRTEARETEPVRPVREHLVNAGRPFVSRQVEALIDLQLLTAMRPGEACSMRACDLDITGRIWIYRPQSHKTQHHGHGREILLGPKAQEIIRPFLKIDVQGYLFSPSEAREERYLKMRTHRKSKVQPSHQCRRKRNPKKLPGKHYDVASYRRAIAYAGEQAFPLPPHLAPRIKSNGKPETRKE
jgi:integrase